MDGFRCCVVVGGACLLGVVWCDVTAGGVPRMDVCHAGARVPCSRERLTDFVQASEDAGTGSTGGGDFARGVDSGDLGTRGGGRRGHSPQAVPGVLPSRGRAVPLLPPHDQGAVRGGTSLHMHR